MASQSLEPAPAIAMDEVTRPGEAAMSSVLQLNQPTAEPPKRARGRQRLLQGIRRMASSTSLTRVGLSSTRAGDGYNGLGRGSMSCISLASPMPSTPSTSSYGHTRNISSPAAVIEQPGPSGYNSSSLLASQSNAPRTGSPTYGNSDMRWPEKNPIRIIGRPLSRTRPSTPLTAPLPSDLRLGRPWLRSPTDSETPSSLPDDYFSIPTEALRQKQPRANFDFWGEMPPELRIRIMGYLEPKEIIRSSAVSKSWHTMCYDGQLWRTLDFSEIYREIPAESLVKILTQAGPFLKDLNLRGCVQMHDRWQTDGQNISDLCRNMEYFSLKDCRIDRRTVHFFLLRNPRLIHVDLSGIGTVNNVAMSILAQNCPNIQYLDVSWCNKINTTGLEEVVTNCRQLRDLRAGKMDGWSSESLLLKLFEINSLERLTLPHCTDFDDNSLLLLMQGQDPLINPLTGLAIVPPRKFRHLDFTGCKNLSNRSLKSLHGAVPDLESLCLHGCTSLTDESLTPLFATVPSLTHLDLEELSHLSNATLSALAASPCAAHLRHLSLSYCESLGDTGVMPLLKACPRLRNLELDNTRIGDLTLHEAASIVHSRNLVATEGTESGLPELSLRLVAYDCANVTWTGILAVLEKNSQFFRRPLGTAQPSYPCEVINLKCFYGFQPTVDEHSKRVLKGELAKATLLARKWHDWMQATEEAGAQGVGAWRRRRRAREAERQMEGEGGSADGMPGRRRARSGGCAIM